MKCRNWLFVTETRRPLGLVDRGDAVTLGEGVRLAVGLWDAPVDMLAVAEAEAVTLPVGVRVGVRDDVSDAVAEGVEVGAYVSTGHACTMSDVSSVVPTAAPYALRYVTVALAMRLA